jgi:serine/threonine-protein kinase
MQDIPKTSPAALEDTLSGISPKTPTGGSLLRGEQVGPYRVGRLLGKGGVGEVYHAIDTRLGRRVALKIARADVAPSALSARFGSEVRLTASLNHPSIVTLYNVGEHDGRPWAALEYLPGRTLRDHLRGGPLPVREALRIGRDVAAALACAHRSGIVHRDVKPDNVFEVEDGSVRVLDFGIAKVALADEDSLGDDDAPSGVAGIGVDTEAGKLVGTPAYMAPEQWLGQRADPATDVFQLALVLFRAITGERAQRVRGSEELARVMLTPGKLPSLPRQRGVTPGLRALLARCLEKSAARRPSAAEMHDALQQLLARSVVELPSAVRLGGAAERWLDDDDGTTVVSQAFTRRSTAVHAGFSLVAERGA